jgi:hypothetical protein
MTNGFVLLWRAKGIQFERQMPSFLTDPARPPVCANLCGLSLSQQLQERKIAWLVIDAVVMVGGGSF